MNFLEVISLKYLILALALTSCLQEPAKIINKNNIKFSKNNKLNQEKYRNITQNKDNSSAISDATNKDANNKNDKKSQESSAENKSKNSESKSNKLDDKSNNKISDKSTGNIIVGSGDTLYSIAKNNNIPLRELIEYNNFEPPYHLKLGDSVKIPQSNYHESRDGDTLYSISRMYNMKVKDLITLNNLAFPYSIYPGDKIKITNRKKDAKEDAKEDIKVATKSDNKNNETDNKLKNTAPVNQINNQLTQNGKEINNKNANNYKFPQKDLHKDDLAHHNNKLLDQNSSQKIADKNNKFYWPIRGPIISKFGPKSVGLYNDGINIKGKEGQTVMASEDGIVAYVGNELKGYGNLIIIKHAGGWISAYAHLRDFVVKRGQKVSRGQKIGAVGNSGKVTSSQLYFGLRKGRDAVNPEKYLNY